MTRSIQDAPLPPGQAELGALHAHWLALCGGRPMAPRDALEPVALRRWLGSLALLDVVEDGADFRFRVHGTVLAKRTGFDMTGRLLSQAASALAPNALAEYREVVRRRAALLVVRSSVLPKPYDYFDKLSLPFSADGANVTAILAGIYPTARQVVAGAA